MEKVTFNLSKFRKQAFYEGGKGLISKQTRCMQNCYKAKLDSGSSAQKAMLDCQAEYQKAGSSDWALKYGSHEK